METIRSKFKLQEKDQLNYNKEGLKVVQKAEYTNIEFAALILA